MKEKMVIVALGIIVLLDFVMGVAAMMYIAGEYADVIINPMVGKLVIGSAIMMAVLDVVYAYKVFKE